MNNRGQNGNPNGTPQNHHPNQGYPQQNNQYQGNGYNGQNQPHNMNNPQYRGQGYNGQNQPHNMNNPQYRGQGNNAQNPQFGNPNNPQFNNQNGYNNPNQFNPQFGNNQNSNPMNRRPKMGSKMVGYITAVVAAIIVVVLMIFMFSSSSGKLGGATPEEAVKNVISARKDGDLKKWVNNIYFESDEARTEALEEWNNRTDDAKKEIVEIYSDIVEIEEIKSTNENSAKVELKAKGDNLLKKFNRDTILITMYAKKVNGRWFVVDN